jgi:isoamyl acetate esterase
MSLDQFVLFGDSITEHSFSQERGFAFRAALSDTYARKLDVINRGLAGYNTRQAIRALPLCTPTPEDVRVRFLTVFFGANDARIHGTPGGPDQSIDLVEFQENIKNMARHPAVVAHDGIKIILITTPPIDERTTGKTDREKYPEIGRILRRTATNTARYAKAIRDIGAELNIPVLDIWTALATRSGYTSREPERTDGPILLLGSTDAPANSTLQAMLYDGLHFSPEGYKVLYGELMALIEREWPEEMPSRLPMKLPAWDEVPAWRRGEAQSGQASVWDVQGRTVHGTFEVTVRTVT